MKTIVFTKEGFENLKKEQQELILKRKGAVETLKKAREMGDLSENGYYKAAKFELVNIDRRLRQLEYYIRYAKVASSSNIDVVEIGSKVIIDDLKEKKEYRIVGEYESNPMEGRLSHKSPLGSKLVGKKVGEKVIISTVLGDTTYVVTKIEEY